MLKQASSAMEIVSHTNPPDTLGLEAVKEKYGADKSLIELSQLVDDDWLWQDNAEVSVLTKEGQFACKRHHLNSERGDQASVDDRRASIENVGLLQDLCGGPFLVQHPDYAKNDHFLVLHWATRLEGLEAAWLADTTQTKRTVQISVRNKLVRCKIYSRKTPESILRFIIEKGNVVNDSVTQVTVLQVWASSQQVEAAFEKKKKSMGWTLASVGAAALDQKKLDVANGLFEDGRFGQHYATLERVHSFYSRAIKTDILVGEFKGYTVWEALSTQAKKITDMTKIKRCMHEEIFKIASDSFRVLRRNHPEYVPLVILMAMPRIGGQSWGACAVVPNGVSSPGEAAFRHAIPDDKFKALLTPMKGTAALQELALAPQLKVELAAKKIVAQEAKTGPKAKANARSNAPKAKGGTKALKDGMVDCDDEYFDEAALDLDGLDFLGHLNDTCDYLVEKVNPNARNTVECFRQCAVFGAAKGSIIVNIKGVLKVVKSFNVIRKMFKVHCYRTARLMPRPSDVDFKMEDGANGEKRQTLDSVEDDALRSLGLSLQQSAMQESRFATVLKETEASSLAMAHFFRANPFKATIIMALPCAASAMNATMMSLLGKQADLGGLFKDTKSAFMELAHAATGEVMKVLPAEWDVVLETLGSLAKQNMTHVALEHDACKLLQETGVTFEYVSSVRMSMCCHVVTCLGMQQYRSLAGPAIVKHVYTPPLVRSMWLEMQNVCDPTKPDAHAPSVLIELLEMLRPTESETKFALLMDVISTRMWELNRACVCADGQMFKISLEALSSALANAKAADYDGICKTYGLQCPTISDLTCIEAKLDEKTKVNAGLIAAYKKNHHNEVEALAIQAEPFKFLLSRIEDLDLKPLREQRQASEQLGAGAGAGSSSDADTALIAAAVAKLKQGPGAVTSFAEVWNKTVAEEREAFVAQREAETRGDAEHMNFQLEGALAVAVQAHHKQLAKNGVVLWQQREIVAKVQQHFCAMANKFFGDLRETKGAAKDLNIGLRTTEPKFTPCKRKAGDEPAPTVKQWEVVRFGQGSCKVPFWGKVVDQSGALHLNRATSIFLGDGGNDLGPRLWLDGSSYMNVHRSDICPWWLVQPLIPPKDKKEKGLAADPADDGAGAEEQEKKTEKNAKVPTHKLEYHPFTVTIDISACDGGKLSLIYMAPYLVDNDLDNLEQPAAIAALHVRCWRRPAAWNVAQPSIKKLKKSTQKPSFVTS